MNKKTKKSGETFTGAPELLRLIRRRVHAGLLPVEAGDETYGGRGTNARCSCCAQPISNAEMELEVHVRPVIAPLLMHVACYQLWWDVSHVAAEASASM